MRFLTKTILVPASKDFSFRSNLGIFFSLSSFTGQNPQHNVEEKLGDNIVVLFLILGGKLSIFFRVGYGGGLGTNSGPALCDHTLYSLQGSSVHGFSKQEYRSRLPFPSPGILPDPGIKPRSPALQAVSFPSEPPRKPNKLKYHVDQCMISHVTSTWLLRDRCMISHVSRA